MVCQDCKRKCRKHGLNRNGTQRFRCGECKKTVSEERENLFGAMRVPEDKALMALHLLVEGMSVRGTSRVTGLHKTTLLKLLVDVGERCERMLAERIVGVPVEDVEIDEVWSFIQAKEKTKVRQQDTNPERGDAFCFLALERTSKLILAWHLGRRTAQHTDTFVEKLARATDSRFQVTSDGFNAYPNAIGYHLGARTDYAVLVKKYGAEPEGERRYSPAQLTGTERTPIHGEPNMERACTSYVERMNLSVRTFMRRWTRLTICFSKCWRNHKAAIALFIAHYNFCRMHSAVRMTPAMAAGIARQPWTLRDLIVAANGERIA
jgi:transposase-like protein/IS1 family transposase